jgi:hypothetical protein
LTFHFIMSKIILHEGNIVAGISDALNSDNVLGVNFKHMVFNEEIILNFILSDGNSLFVFRNMPYQDNDYNLSYSVIDGQFIGIKTQERLDNILEKNQLVEFEQNGSITTIPLETTLPVELSYFNGTVELDNTVTMSWQTASETGMAGFNIYRGSSAQFEDAIKLNTELIIASNDANGNNYQFTDTETSLGQVYRYWLECIDTSGTVTHFANVTVTIPNHDDNIVPITVTNHIYPNYPNPFHQGKSTRIPIHIRTGESGIMTIYNIKGQKVKEYRVSAGSSNLVWDGTNLQGGLCAPGIYLTQLKTNGLNDTRKLLMVK